MLKFKVPKVRTNSRDYRDCYDLCEQNGWKHGTLLAPVATCQDGVLILWEIAERWIILRGTGVNDYSTLDLSLDWREMEGPDEPKAETIEIDWPEDPASFHDIVRTYGRFALHVGPTLARGGIYSGVIRIGYGVVFRMECQGYELTTATIQAVADIIEKKGDTK